MVPGLSAGAALGLLTCGSFGDAAQSAETAQPSADARQRCKPQMNDIARPPDGAARSRPGHAGEAQPGEAPPGVRRIGVFLLDDHEIVRRGVRELLEAEPDIVVVGEAGTAASALARIPALHPDVAILDVRLPDGDGVSVCRDIRSTMPEVACLMLTSFGDDEALFDAIMAGAAGYVLKQIRGTDLVGAVRAVAAGQSLLDPEAASRVMRRMRDQATRSDPLSGLTGQERRILELIGEGLTNRQIGVRMFLAEKTIKNYVSALFAKLGMERRTQAAAYAARVFESHDQDKRRAPAG
jgi:DNA-binding NarL/FixJ family response regulator